MLAQSTAEVMPEPGEKPYSLEEYSLDHFRYADNLIKSAYIYNVSVARFQNWEPVSILYVLPFFGNQKLILKAPVTTTVDNRVSRKKTSKYVYSSILNYEWQC